MNRPSENHSERFPQVVDGQGGAERRYRSLRRTVNKIKKSSLYTVGTKAIPANDDIDLETFKKQVALIAENAKRIEELESINKSHQEALRFVAHELKNPVASMMTNATLLSEGYLGDVNSAQRHKLERITKSGQYLISFIDSYLDLARVEHAEQAPRHVDIDCLASDVLGPAIDLLRGQAEGRCIDIITDMSDRPQLARGNAELLRVVSINLIGNAIKYGNYSGSVKITLRYLGDRAEVNIWNDGPGFPAEKRGELFQQFSRQNTPELIRRKGTGLGLYTCWRIIQMHGGDIWAESEQGSWACFSFYIPIDSNLPPVRRYLPGDGDTP